MDYEMYGGGLIDVIDLQRRFNELDLLMQRQIRLSASEDPLERIRQIGEWQAELAARVDDLTAPPPRDLSNE